MSKSIADQLVATLEVLDDRQANALSEAILGGDRLSESDVADIQASINDDESLYDIYNKVGTLGEQ